MKFLKNINTKIFEDGSEVLGMTVNEVYEKIMASCLSLYVGQNISLVVNTGN